MFESVVHGISIPLKDIGNTLLGAAYWAGIWALADLVKMGSDYGLSLTGLYKPYGISNSTRSNNILNSSTSDNTSLPSTEITSNTRNNAK